MPIYEYRCNQCMSFVQVSRSYDDQETEIICPKCDLVTTRVYNTPSIQFKGTGFYKTGG
jgi:putative FmdB family regulatory protein